MTEPTDTTPAPVPTAPAVRDPYTFRELPTGATTSADGRPLPEGWADSHVHCVAMAGARASGKSLYTAVMVKQLE